MIEFTRSEELMIPTDYTVRLSRGLAVSGLVRNERDEPIAGVRLTLERRPTNSTQRDNTDYLSEMAYCTSDAQGEWTCDFIAPEHQEVVFILSHPDYAPRKEAVALKDAGSPRIFTMSR